jgi:hypothetical protein
MKIHATGKPSMLGGHWLCRPTRVTWGTSSTYANCKNCLRILKSRDRAQGKPSYDPPMEKGVKPERFRPPSPL